MSTPHGGPGPDEPYDVTESDQDTSGEMGVSSERTDADGATTGVRDVSPAGVGEPDVEDADEKHDEVLPEQSAGGEEPTPAPMPPPVGGYPSHHPDSDENPYEPGRKDQRPSDDSSWGPS